MITERDQLVMSWQQAKASLVNAVKLERSLRDNVMATFFPREKAKIGVNNADLGRGYILKGTYALSYSLDTENDSARTYEVVEAIEALGNEGTFLADRLVKWKPELSVAEYKKLDPNNPTHRKIKELIDSVLTIKDASPTVEVVSPKA